MTSFSQVVPIRRRIPFFKLLPTAVLLLAATPTSRAAFPPEAAAADYEKLRQGRYSTRALSIPADGVSFRRAEASWILEEGQVRFQEPASDGSVTGLVFEGRGRFRMSAPDPVELDQLRRVAERPDLDGIDEPFTALVLRTSEDLIRELFGTPPASGYEQNALARKRHENWLERRAVDADARVLCGLLIPGDCYLRAEMKTESFDWLTYEYDALDGEEILLAKYQPQSSSTEEWVRLDRPRDRDARGRPGGARRDLIDVGHVDVKIDLTRAGKRARSGLSDIYPRHARFVAEIGQGTR